MSIIPTIRSMFAHALSDVFRPLIRLKTEYSKTEFCQKTQFFVKTELSETEFLKKLSLCKKTEFFKN